MNLNDIFRLIVINTRVVEDCWLWTGASSAGASGDRYGSVVYEQKPWLVHRLVWTAFEGEIPEGLIIGHYCNTKKCCNLSHLYLCTVSQNFKDAWADGLCQPYKLGMAKLSLREVTLLKALLRAKNPKVSVRQWAKIVAPSFKVSHNTIRSIATGNTWAWNGAPL